MIASPAAPQISHPIARAIARTGGLSLAPSTDALVIVLLGQSLNTARGTKVDTASPSKSRMPIGGCSIAEYTFSGVNLQSCPNYAALASVVAFSEGTGQSPCSGLARTLESSTSYGRAYIGSVAIGSRRLDVLHQGGPRITLCAMVHRLCDLARADGYTPYVAFYSAHGEADATAATGESTYYSRGLDYYKMAQLYARQAMGNAAYTPPVVLTYPQQQKEGENDRNIKNAIKSIIADLPGAIDGGPIFQWPGATDLVHPTDAGMVYRGESAARSLLQTVAFPRMTGVALSGSTATVTYSEAVVRDASLGVGSALAGTDGFEWIDNGSPITIDSISGYGTSTLTFNLHSAPVGTKGQQVLRYAEQLNVPTAAAPANEAGGNVRADDLGWGSDFAAYTNYRWAIPQRVSGVS